MWKKPLALLGTSALICAGEMARELSTFRVRRYRMEVPGLENGREIGYGTHEELMASCEPYRQISLSQMGGETDEAHE